jgi:nicotinate-nucleotide adenylyltransferase
VTGAIGLFGGTFDPIHVGHLAIAESIRDQLDLEQVVFIPAADPRHRNEPHASASQRAAMVELAIADNGAFTVDRLELERGGPTYTVDTLEAYAARGIVDPWFVLSAEALAGLPGWRTPEQVLELARLAVVPRPGARATDRAWVEARFPGSGDRVAFVDGPLLPISATAIRARVAADRSIRYLVPDAVLGYITDHGLYRP